ncbi:MAG: hypothetical protein LBS55_02200 [Prevotellaceae bacterium]|jgi:hypothetical protein|nr:hypothetical protein [Prevotellaceae bacterium]
MNIKYYYEFRGLDEVLNRVEILTDDSAQAQSVTPSGTPFVLSYPEQKKLTPVQGAGASIGLSSQSLFQFRDLHTDDMQKYMVKFYRAGSLYWVGWLDSELYSEKLSDYFPYNVEFSSSDFNILDRLKFRDENDSAYDDITTLIRQIKRCLDKLGLPFNRLYIGCSTISNTVDPLPVSESMLHKLYIQSSNFYDEENEPETCREVIESILRPFGLMMVQKNTNVYIYDYNSVSNGSAMICYDFETLDYISHSGIGYNFGEILSKGTASVDGTYGFEEMINNTNITSSIYAKNPMFDETVRIDDLSEKKSTGTETDKYKLELYGKHAKIENPNGAEFAVYTNKDSSGELTGAKTAYSYDPTTKRPEFRIVVEDYMTGSGKQYYLNIKISAYANTRTNPFDEDEVPEDEENLRIMIVDCNVYTIDDQGSIKKYFNNRNPFISGSKSDPLGRWVPVSEAPLTQGLCRLLFANIEPFNASARAINGWRTNSDVPPLVLYNEFYPDYVSYVFPKISDARYEAGLNMPLPINSPVNGYVVFEITNSAFVGYRGATSLYESGTGIVKNILFSNISVSVTDAEKKQAPTDDYEFKSYVNKKVAADYEAVTLKVISANEAQLPVGRACILRRESGAYKLNLSFTRAGQTNILERLLMRTIHSNYTKKNEKFSVDVNGCNNPAMSYVKYNPVLSDIYMVTGCEIDFSRAKTTLNAVGFSADTAQLSDIQYD